MNKKYFLLGVAIFLLSFVFRFQTTNIPFWVDEFSSAYQAKLFNQFGVSVFSQPNYYIEHHNITTHFLIAIFFKFFGVSEFSARLPLMIIGSFIPVLIFWLGKKISNTVVGLTASILAVFSYFMITWSRQARGYVIQQALVLLLFLLYFNILETKKSSQKLLFTALMVVVTLLGLLTHTMFIFALAAVCVHFIFFYPKKVFSVLRNPISIVCILVILCVSIMSGLFGKVFTQILSTLQGNVFNNVWYYHSFLWRQYSLITFLAAVGLLLGLYKNLQKTSLLIIHASFQLFFLMFLFGPYVSRYILPIFPTLLLGVSLAFSYLSEAFYQKNSSVKIPAQVKYFTPVFLAMFIIMNGNLFTIKPKTYYSVNHDFREIAVIEYDKVYDLIRQKGELEKGQTAVIDTWGDRLDWYLGSEFKGSYFFRWINAPGLMKTTKYSYNEDNEKVIVDRNNQRFIGELSDLEAAVKKYPKGFIWIDDSTLPEDVLEYAQKNFKKELYIDHHPLDDNPYSIWPGTLYSWGIE